MQRIILPVEPEPGSTSQVVISNPVKDWAKLNPKAWAKRSTDGTYVLRADHFHHSKLVSDAVRARVQGDGLEEIEPYAPRPGSAPLIVLLESPHKNEYSKDIEEFAPQWPLNGESSRKKMQRHLRRLTEAAGFTWADIQSKEVTLVNPVPLQTSMHRFFPHKEGLHKTLRDQVWCALFSQTRYFKLSLQLRIDQYAPFLILNACTKNLQDEVHKVLTRLPYQSERISNHPSMWFSRDRLLRPDEVRVLKSPCTEVKGHEQATTSPMQ